ncbi:oligosaccharide flippase family protein [Pricia sp. S334]|uniref:Oligosaccharide flippase family protein n=1 Tax=Pricia mediterranea TaxID=3076079 RepID=A0ABU3L380_9FLAO|nr:oligosaccharide flippase family protein [Pricia sp. S334]MDT7828090.1 oligosaccharide flippase family protein [Pricia sp. S334]
MKIYRVLKTKISQSQIIQNSAWGIGANILQTIFVGLFFVILARQYNSADFAFFLIASTVYQILVAFSSMGLGQWFIREFDVEIDKAGFTGKFIKIQTGLGLIFYLINIVLALILYPDAHIRWLCIILGSNIIFDNIIYCIKNLNIAEFKQKKTFSVLVLDAFFRLMLGCLLLIYPFSITTLCILLISVRFLTLNLFIKVGSSNTLNLKYVFHSTIAWEDVKRQILLNWQFVVIGSVAIIYWRISNIIIAKTLTLQDVADYEISFKILSIGMILPTIVAATVYTQFVKYYNSGDKDAQKLFYKKLFFVYSIYSVMSYSFIYSFADILLPYVFGEQYVGAILSLKEMFLTMLIFPTVLLQANLIVAMKHEKVDMLLNIFSFLIYLAGCFIGLSYFKSLTVINYSIFVSFIIFHISQNIFLAKRGITNFKNSLIVYILLLVFALGYNYIADHYNPIFVFMLFTLMLSLSLVFTFLYIKKGNGFDKSKWINKNYN